MEVLFGRTQCTMMSGGSGAKRFNFRSFVLRYCTVFGVGTFLAHPSPFLGQRRAQSVPSFLVGTFHLLLHFGPCVLSVTSRPLVRT